MGLTPFFSDTFSAPYVKESEVNIGLKVAQHFSLLNNTEMVIGEIQEVFFAKDALDKDGYLDIEALNTASISGLDSYHSSKRLARYAYAKPNVPLETK